MRLLTYTQFFQEPPGVLFGQLYGLPHRDSGLWRKGISYAPDENDEDFEDGCIIAMDLLFMLEDQLITPSKFYETITPGSLESDHKFEVYESSDIRRLMTILSEAHSIEFQRAIGQLDEQDVPVK